MSSMNSFIIGARIIVKGKYNKKAIKKQPIARLIKGNASSLTKKPV